MTRILSGRSGDPDNFPYPQAPYFTDVPSSHPQFAYIQKMRELGITSGYTATTYYPEGSLSFSQLAVFTYRGRQLRFNQPLTPPPACTFSFLDVSSSHPFCGYIQTIYYGWLGENAKSPNCYTGLCPDSLAVDRGTSAFYLVTGIMASTVPEFLPNSAGQLPAVNLATFPGLEECNHGDSQGDYYYANHIDVIGQQMRAWADTGVINPSNPVVWDNYVALDFWQSGSWPPLYTQNYSTGSGLDNAHLESGYHFANSSYNYLSDSRHQVTSFCITGGSTSLQTKNDPMILSTNTTVLYRGMTQAITFRGSSLGSVQGVESPHAALGGSVLNSQQFQATVNVTTPSNATAGNISVRLSAVAPIPQVQNGFAPTSGESHKTNYLTMIVADPTPVLSSLSRYSGTQGEVPFAMTLHGAYFGANPRVCINGVCSNGAGSSAMSNDVTLTQQGCSDCTGTNAVLSVTVAIASNATLGTNSISVLSWGATGNGWAPAPPGQNQQGSGQLGLQVQAAIPPTVRLQSVYFDPVGTAAPGSPQHFVYSWRALGSDYTSEANMSAPLTNLVYDDPSLGGTPSLAPATFRLFHNQTTPLSRRPKLSFVILKTVGSTAAFNSTLRIESSNPKLQFPDAAISFANGEGRVEGLTALADFSAIDNYTTTLTFKLLSNPEAVIASFTLPVYVVFDVPWVLPDHYPSPGLLFPSASKTVTDKRIAFATMLAAGSSSVANAVAPIITHVKSRFGTGPVNIADYSYNAWILYAIGNSTIRIDCISFALTAAAILNMAGIHANVGFSFPTWDADALLQDSRFIGPQKQYLRMYEPDGLDANDFEGYLETVVDNKAYTVWPPLLDIQTLQADIINGTSDANRRAFSVMYRMTGPTQRWEQWWTTGDHSAFAVYISQEAFPYP